MRKPYEVAMEIAGLALRSANVKMLRLRSASFEAS